MDKAPIAVNMALVDPNKSAVLGLPQPKPAVHNPFYEATELDKIGDHKSAERIYTELLNADFDNPILHAAYGMNLAMQERNGLAYTLLTRALTNVEGMLGGFKRLGVVAKADKAGALDDFWNTKRSEVMNAIGTCYKHENNVPLAREWFLKAQELIPLNPDIQNNLGTLYINEGKPQEALKYLDLAIGIQPEHPQARWNKSLAHLELGDYAKGWAGYDAGFDAKVRIERAYTRHELPRWDGSPGKTIVVYGEQGIGDEILFASCLRELIGMSKQVVFDCHKKLHRLFSTSFPEIDIYPTREDPTITWPVAANNQPRYAFDARVAIGSLPQFFRNDLASFNDYKPYIKPDVAAEAEWCAKLAALGDKPKIGISWIGGHKRTRVEVRSCHLEQLLPILVQDAVFVSLQYTEGDDKEIAAFEQKHGIKIHHFPEATHSPNYADCAALVSNLDLVITVCTSVVHLAGSMGVPTWVLTPSRPAWRYRLDLDHMPWYGSYVTLFRQQPDTTDWSPVVKEVSEHLTDLLESTHGREHP